MSYSIRRMKPESEFNPEVSVGSLNRVITEEALSEVIAECDAKEQRERKLPTRLVMLICVAMSLWSQSSLEDVVDRLFQGEHLLAGWTLVVMPVKSAISAARYRVGAKPMERLFKRVCQPLATPATTGAFAFGLRMMAIDGSIESVADSPANDAYFGRSVNGRSESAFPLMQTVYLCECGTHAIVDAGCWPYATSERKGGKRMLRSVTEGMLVMWDRGFHAHEMIRGVMDRGAHLLSRLPAHVKPRFRGRLPDGTWLGTLASSTQPDAPPVTVRIVEYHITDPKRDGFGERHRLITTLIDPNTYPAFQLAALYHERWEVELAIDEMDTHQRLADRPFRSKKPVGVIQEFYGLLLAHFVVRSVIHEAAVTHEMDPDRISFVQALRLVARSIMEFQLVHPRGHTALWQRLLTNVSHRLLPQRRRRSNPRVVKRKMSKFRRKRPKHQSIRFDKPFLRSLSLQERSVGSSA